MGDRIDDEVLLLDEPDDHLDVPAKERLAERLSATPKTVLLASHDRRLPADAAETLSGGQQARLQILLLELSGATLLLLDEPTDTLDLASAEALQEGLRSYEGTVLAVTHDRWFAEDFDRYLVFASDGHVRGADEPTWRE